MSTATQQPGDVNALISSIQEAYRRMEMPVRTYLLIIVLPSFVFAVGTIAITVALSLSLTVGGPLVLLGLFSVVAALLYPKAVQDRQRKQIRQRFHLFLTHITVLSMTNINRVEIFRTLAEEDEYQALAEEMGYLVALVDTWNQSLDDACRMRARQVNSPLLSDFLERLAYTIGGGQQISEFLIDEQESIIQQFVIRYEADLNKLDVMKELYLSMMLSTAFVLVFAIVLPVLVGVNPTLAVGAVIGMFVIVQAGFVYAIHTISPYDPVWYIQETAGDYPLKRALPAMVVGGGLSIVSFAVVGGILLGYLPIESDILPLPIMAAIPVTPLLIPGWLVRREEKKVQDRDSEFPSFIRALGAVESVKQTSTGNVLETLRKKDFGSLTKNIDNLYKRLNIRIDSTRSWALFAAETGSYLIQKFGDMYVEGRRMGGDPKMLGQVISRNLGEVLKVREQRQQATTTLIGVLYGLTAASVFSFFVGLEVVELLMQITEDMNLSASQMSFLLSTKQYDVQMIEFLLILTIVLNAVLSSIMIRVTDRGHMLSGYVHFVALTWTGALTAELTRYVVDALISV
ncbi:archaellar assembly protein FlaJ [Haloarchaeobius sp. HME9146]|uniref:archaellar assembly protein FlaJ n=1 Tax=Haloarchaeobius sp. HME9146 TaxID=2978732 RepID=UPI0021BDF95F|nr:archaellar assembly protein FlaJ [Haloarchaeobius sp. HME9146]MCT9095203.1 archaellar assembly protein FlaJ [Haloarchaeobius sp. HME9146]